MNMWTKQDQQQIAAHGLTTALVDQQIEQFRSGFPFLDIQRTAVMGDGISRLSRDDCRRYGELYNDSAVHRQIVKFIPASGAATRMFKSLFEYLNSGERSAAVDEVLSHIDRFAFAQALHQLTGGSTDPRVLIDNIAAHGLGYGHQPKALVLFHRYADGSRTALEEHLSEGALYAVGAQQRVALHFTVSPEHLVGFKECVEQAIPRFEAKYGVHYAVSYSVQKPSTDTIAVDPSCEPFRDEHNALLFRPAGHGALIENLNEIEADLIFIKTVDNVAPDSLKSDTIYYKKALAGLLLSLQHKAFHYLRLLDRGETSSLSEMASFVEGSLCRKLSRTYTSAAPGVKACLMREILDRPVRVCGMVRNEGEPGGGPVWVADAEGGASLQIAEMSQIGPDQKSLMATATHFNPVDLVCGVRNYKGEKYDLRQYVDPKTGFISSKSQQGRPLQALELPGLWNGAMARWNTVFVEVPISTFSPVKTINDLLRPQHCVE